VCSSDLGGVGGARGKNTGAIEGRRRLVKGVDLTPKNLQGRGRRNYS
jgi:hypothetical protein